MTTFGREKKILFLLYVPMLVASDINTKNRRCSFLKKENDNTGITEAQSPVPGMLKHLRHIIYTALHTQVKS